MNKDAMNIFVQSFGGPMHSLLDINLEVELLDHWVDICLVLLANSCPKWLNQIHFHQQCIKASVALHPV